MFDLSRSSDVNSSMTIRFPESRFLSVVFGSKSLSLTDFEIFNRECDAMVDMT